MEVKSYGRLLVCLLSVCLIRAESVTFPSGEILSSVDPSTVPNADEYADGKDTGSYLFKSSPAIDSTELSLNIRVVDFRSSSSEYFRAHPLFISCLQSTLTYLRNRQYKVELVSGFKTKSDVSAGVSVQQLYERSGCGATIRIKPGNAGNETDIARAALHSCPFMFSKIQRDIGVILLTDSVHIHMTGSGDPVPHFSSSGMASFNSWAQERITEGIEPVGVPLDCSKFAKVSNTDRFPDWGDNASVVVGPIDIKVTRDKTNDFKRLLQYLGQNVEFPVVELNAGWCGSTGNPCVDCRSGYVGNAAKQRCANRMMTARMYQVVNILQKLSRNKLSDKIRIVKSWNEPYAGNPDGDTEYNDLHKEGRMVVVELVTSNTASRLEQLSQLALCAGADLVEHKGTKLEIAVKKMKGDTELAVNFPSVTLIDVEPPDEKLHYYSLPSTFSEEEQLQYPLHYVKGRENIELSDNAFVENFKSGDENYDYFRLNPRIPQCYSAIVYQLNKFNKPGDQTIKVDVVRGFLSNPEQAALFNPTTDNRYDTHTLGVAMQIRYSAGTPSNYTYPYLLQIAIQKCGPLFDLDSEFIGLGLYSDSIFIDMREIFEFWVESDALLPTGMDFDAYDDFLETEYQAAIEGRIVDPDDLDEACSIAVVPKKPSPDYNYEEPELNKRKKRSTAKTTCVPLSATDFCTSSKPHRQAVVDELWNEMSRKFIYHTPSSEVLDAIKGCFLDCGTCHEGDIYESKEKYCSNLIHWQPYALLNEDADVTNFFSKDKASNKKYACKGGAQCLHKSPAFSKLAPSVYSIYRPNPNKSPEEELYSSVDNPTPVMIQLEEMYAINAKGVVKFWVEDEIDVTSQEAPLKVAMLYNKDVTKVEIYVSKPFSIPAVNEKLENMIRDMSSTGCTYHTRRIIAPFSVHEVPHSVKKRAAINYGIERDRERGDKRWLKLMAP